MTHVPPPGPAEAGPASRGTQGTADPHAGGQTVKERHTAMSRINTNVSSLVAQRALQKNNANLNTSLQRLSTGLRINTGADDPAGLIAANNLQAEKTGISTAIDNASRASNIVGTAEGGLNEVSSLLDQLNGLVGQSANTGGLSQEEQDAKDRKSVV